MSDDEEEYVYEDDDDSGGEFVAMDSSMYDGAVDETEDMVESSGAEYKILTPNDLLEEQNGLIDKISGVCNLPNPAWSRVLLRFFKWDVESLLNTYWDKGQEEVFKKAGIDFGERGADGEEPKEVECQACFDDVPLSDAYAPSCGHFFCNDCWTAQISLKVKEGQAQKLNCMGYKCTLLLDDAVILNFVDEEIKGKFMKQLMESYVDDNEAVQWCSSVPHCGNCVRVTGVGKCCDAQCSCGHSFCFKCLSDTHSPATCDMNRKWKEKCKEDSETCEWLKANTKDCPSCHHPIEKNGGCNYVACTKCSREFCWMCMFICPKGDSHTSHDCNKYKGSDETEGRDSLNRYMFYYERFKAHNESQKFEAALRLDIFEKATRMTKELAASLASNEVQWLLEGLEKLFQCRHIMKNSYIFAFFMFDATVTKHCPIPLTDQQRKVYQGLFEDHQQQLENTTEKLSGTLEKPLDSFLTTRETAREIQNLTTLAETRLRALYDVVHRDILKGDCGIIAPYHVLQPSPYHTNDRKNELAELRQKMANVRAASLASSAFTGTGEGKRQKVDG